MKTTEYIFCINTGRSGSDYLKGIFESIPSCLAFHEPDPIGNDKTMRQFLQGEPEPMRKLAEEKAGLILDLIKEKDKVYVETNHCFIKGFGWFLPEHLSEKTMGVVILKRDKNKIAKSLLRIGCSPFVKKGRCWIATPERKDPRVTPPWVFGSPRISYFIACFVKKLFRGISRLSCKVRNKAVSPPQWLTNYEMQCLLWYVDETDQLTKEYRQKFPHIKYYEISLESLNDLEQVRRMLRFFGIDGGAGLQNVVGIPTNQRIEHP